MTIPDRTIDDLCKRYGRFRTRELRAGGRSRSVMHTPATRDTKRSYWQSCQACYGTGADLGAVGSGIKSRESLIELATHPDKAQRKLCPKCDGRGGRHETAALADPAAIPATGPGGMYVPMNDTPPEFIDLEAALDGMDEANQHRGFGPRHRAVIEARYVHFPRSRATQDHEEYGQKARVEWVNGRIHPDKISGKMFGYYLTTTRRRLAEIFGVPATLRDLEDSAEIPAQVSKTARN